MINELAPNQIFVFGSNTAGIHGSGAALQARRQFGAELYIGEGLTGQCYAFPTLNGDTCGPSGLILRKRSHDELCQSVCRFFDTCDDMPDMEFLLTKVGCGLAGYAEEYMKSLFVWVPSNVVKPEGW